MPAAASTARVRAAGGMGRAARAREAEVGSTAVCVARAGSVAHRVAVTLAALAAEVVAAVARVAAVWVAHPVAAVTVALWVGCPGEEGALAGVAPEAGKVEE